MERATGIEPVLPAWESILGALYFQYLQNRSVKINVHPTHTVHALPDLRIAGGRLGDGCSQKISITTDQFSVIAKAFFTAHETAHTATVKSRRPKLMAQPQENDETGENLAQTAYESQSADF